MAKYSIEKVNALPHPYARVWYGDSLTREDITKAAIGGAAGVSRARAGMRLVTGHVYVVDENTFIYASNTYHIYVGGRHLGVLGKVTAVAFPYNTSHLYIVSNGRLSMVDLASDNPCGVPVDAREFGATTEFVLGFIMDNLVILRTGDEVSFAGSLQVRVPVSSVRLEPCICTIKMPNGSSIVLASTEQLSTRTDGILLWIKTIPTRVNNVADLEWALARLSLSVSVSGDTIVDIQAVHRELDAILPKLAHIPRSAELVRTYKGLLRSISREEIMGFIRRLAINSREKIAADALVGMSD